MIPSPPPDLWPLDDFVAAANDALPGVLPDAPVVRIERTVTPRLVRYLTTQGVLTEPHKAGREARYDRRHLLDLLAVRRLMALGYTVAAIGATVRSGSDSDVEAMLTGAIEVTAAADAAPGAAAPSLPGPSMAASVVPPRRAMSTNEAAVGESAADFLRGLGGGGASVRPAPPAFSRPSPRGASPERWTRVEIARGIDLHVRDDAHLPASPNEREQIAARIVDALRRLSHP